MDTRHNRFGLRETVLLYFRQAPLTTSAMYLLKLLFSLLPFLTVIVNARFVDRALTVSKEGYTAVLEDACLIALLMLIRETGNNLYSFLRTRQWSRVYPVVDRMVTEKIALLPYEKVENDAVQDILSRVREDPEGLLSGIVEGYLGLGGFLISNISLVAVLAAQAPIWVSVIISAMLCLFGIFAVKGGEKQYNAQAEAALCRRKAEYYGDILGNRSMADERMLFQYGERVNEMFLRESREARELERRSRRWWFVGMNIGAYMAIGISVTVILALLPPVLRGKTSAGLFVSMVTAFMSMTQSITWQLPNMLKEMARGKHMLKDFDTVLQMPVYRGKTGEPDGEAVACAEAEGDTEDVAVVFETLEFCNVSFKYPGTEKEVLRKISFRIEKGRHYAIAGRNGCGKSTIVKLILRLYEPDEGEILLNGKDIRKYAPEQIWAVFAVLFQDYARYPLSVYENIALGSRTGRADNAIRLESRALSAAGVDELIERLPHGLDTELGKLSEGSVDISGGEWQRISMARMNCSEAEVRILDEPTASMDPIQEQAVYRQFSGMNQDHTTIMITHRLGATSLSDCIFVIEEGQVTEEGSHGFLMEKQGIYREMYEKQREWYL